MRKDLGTPADSEDTDTAFGRIKKSETFIGTREDAESIDVESASIFAVLKYLKNNLPALRYIVLKSTEELPDPAANQRVLALKHRGEGVSESNIFTEYLSVEDTTAETPAWKWEKLGEAGLDIKDIEELKKTVEKIKQMLGTEEDPHDPEGSAFARIGDLQDRLGNADDPPTAETAFGKIAEVKKEADDTKALLGDRDDTAEDDTAFGAIQKAKQEAIKASEVFTVDGNKPGAVPFKTKETTFAGGNVAVLTGEDGKVSVFIRESKDNPLPAGGVLIPEP